MARVLIASLVLVVALAADGESRAQVPPPLDLGIQNLPQETMVWCWAAVAQQIILKKRGPAGTPPQCAMVALANGAHPAACCNAMGRFNGNFACMRTGAHQQIQALIAHFGGSYSQIAPPTHPMALYQVLRQGRPIILHVASGQGASHVVVLRGMAWQQTPWGVQPVLFINDPLSYFSQPVPFQQLVGIWLSAIVVN